MGVVQGLALPFRGFSRSGSTISVGMLVGATKERAEHFSFAMAVVLTPPVVGLEALRLQKASHAALFGGTSIDLRASLMFSVLGMGFSFLAGLVALKWLSSWLGERPLVFVWNLLPARFRLCLLPPRERLLAFNSSEVVGIQSAHLWRLLYPTHARLQTAARQSAPRWGARLTSASREPRPQERPAR